MANTVAYYDTAKITEESCSCQVGSGFTCKSYIRLEKLLMATTVAYFARLLLSIIHRPAYYLLLVPFVGRFLPFTLNIRLGIEVVGKRLY